MLPPLPVCCCYQSCGAPATRTSPSGYHYCTEHAHCARCGCWDWRYHDEWGVWLCSCFWKPYYALGEHLKAREQERQWEHDHRWQQQQQQQKKRQPTWDELLAQVS